jgi:hypothetical protein
MATSLVSAVVFAAAVHALAYPGPKATGAAKTPLDATSPRPTTPPALHEFLRRDNSNEQTVLIAPDNTCGYVSGQSGSLPPSPLLSPSNESQGPPIHA